MNLVASRAAFRRSSRPVARASGFSLTSFARLSSSEGRVISSEGFVVSGLSISTDMLSPDKSGREAKAGTKHALQPSVRDHKRPFNIFGRLPSLAVRALFVLVMQQLHPTTPPF